MIQNIFTYFDKNKIYYLDFKDHFYRLSVSSISKLEAFLPEMKTIHGLFNFAEFWYQKLMSWEGELDAELVFLVIKSLVLAGKSEKVEIIARGFEFHLGCLAWILGSFNRENKKKKQITKLVLDLQTIFFEEIEKKKTDFDQAMCDGLAWLIAYLPIEESFSLYENHKKKIKDNFPRLMLLKKLIKEHRLQQAFEFLNETHSMDNFDQNSIINNLILNEEGILYQLTGKLDNAILIQEMVLERSRELGDILLVAKLFFNLGASYFYQSNFNLALNYWRLAKRSYEEIADTVGIAKAIMNLSTIYNIKGEFGISEKYLLIAKELFQQSNSTMVKAVNIKLAHILLLRSKYRQSLSLCENQLSLKGTILDYEIRSLQVENYIEIGKYQQALDQITRAIELAHVIGYQLGEYNGLTMKAKVLVKMGYILEAINILDDSYKRHVSIKNLRGQINSLELLSYCYLLMGEKNEADAHIRTALEFSRQLGLFKQEQSCLYTLALLSFYHGQLDYSFNILEKLFYNLKAKDIKNDLYFSGLLLKLKIKLKNKPLGKLDRLEFIESTKTSGIYYWELFGCILELTESSIRKSLQVEKNNCSYELWHSIQLQLLKKEIQNISTENTINTIESIEVRILKEIASRENENSIVLTIEYKIILLLLLYSTKLITNNSHKIIKIYNDLMTTCVKNGLSLYANRVKKMKVELEEDPTIGFEADSIIEFGHLYQRV